jgi:hypothetical protein
MRSRPRLVTFPRVVMSVLLAFAGAALYVSATLEDDSTEPVRPSLVRTVSPAPGSAQLRQTEIFVELPSDYRGRLIVNGKPIPEDQVHVVPGLNRISFTPGKDKEIESLPAGQNCAVVSYQPVPGLAGQPGSYRWCFNVH